MDDTKTLQEQLHADAQEYYEAEKALSDKREAFNPDQQMVDWVKGKLGDDAADEFALLIHDIEEYGSELSTEALEAREMKKKLSELAVAVFHHDVRPAESKFGKGKLHPHITIKRNTAIEIAEGGLVDAVRWLVAHNKGGLVSIKTRGETDWFKQMAKDKTLPRKANAIESAVAVYIDPAGAIDAIKTWDVSIFAEEEAPEDAS